LTLISTLDALSDGTLPSSFRGLRSHVDVEWIESALARGGVATVRKRKLPVEEVVWLVIGISLYRDRPMVEVVHRLDLVQSASDGAVGQVTKGAIPQARERVGVEPMKILFETTARHWAWKDADEDRWRGLMVLGADGSTLRVSDSPENRKAFRLPPQSRGRSAGYPQVRVSVLMALRSRVWMDFDFADNRTGEGPITWPLIQRVPDESVTILDGYYGNYAQLQELRLNGKDRHWVLRAKKNARRHLVKRLGPGDDLVEIALPSNVRKAHPEQPARFLVRLIRYRRKGFRSRVLMTSLIDPQAYPAAEIVELYHERWELELGYDELKTHTLEREETIRSQTPDHVRQELWGMAIAYNLVRREMDLFARAHKLPPRRISFRTSLMLIRDLFMWAATASPGSLPKMIKRLRLDMNQLVLPPRATDRRYPRHVKLAWSRYARNNRHPRASTVNALN
jgi:hypothetical protein